MLHISFFNILFQVDSSSSLFMLLQYLTCLLSSVKLVGNTQVYHSIQIKDLLGQMIIFQLSTLVLHIPMIYAQPDQTDRFHRCLL